MIENAPPELVLASSSPYRRELLTRLRIPFRVLRPLVDESVLAGESALLTAARLARQKAESVRARCPQSVLIGSDQVASWRDLQIGKPGNYERALEQLEQFQGETVLFHSALCVLDQRSGRRLEDIVTVSVRFRRLPQADLEAYLRTEEPYDCAGSAKAEGLGIALLERVDSDDPTALIGLPLIRLVSMLQELNYPLLSGRAKPQAL